MRHPGGGMVFVSFLVHTNYEHHPHMKTMAIGKVTLSGSRHGGPGPVGHPSPGPRNDATCRGSPSAAGSSFPAILTHYRRRPPLNPVSLHTACPPPMIACNTGNRCWMMYAIMLFFLVMNNASHFI